ncbi:hypothetical protein OG508_23380 [Streptomyces sp. NBC_01108]|uniref:hypothetical protein n=1 Tax=Streptomyces sp. NBC_01108 TaxID=2903751 RepID=UPI0038732EEE|nr:hypothetical protein OG508_23380 [Streptomyces sp. NBC_01108]
MTVKRFSVTFFSAPHLVERRASVLHALRDRRVPRMRAALEKTGAMSRVKTAAMALASEEHLVREGWGEREKDDRFRA